ncbi:methyltransferase domain-containing protein [Salinibacterium sp. SYSU T00001]|nr:methyltransferase domain-containing protein [Salinibacterium sedimenticola]MCW4385887.1 methyltransferase domain-containing protein [Salinibacterium sedimenticola]
MDCHYYDANRCRSCSLLEQPYPAQLAGKQQSVRSLLAEHRELEWLPPVRSAEVGFRNKAKLVVGGSVAEPTLGILDRQGLGVDLQDCPLYPDELSECFPALAEFVTRTGLAPYDVPRRRGILKYFIVTVSPDAELMLRIVVARESAVAVVRDHLEWLQQRMPRLAVVSVNLHPEHKAVLEGDEEIVLTQRAFLPMRLRRAPLPAALPLAAAPSEPSARRNLLSAAAADPALSRKHRADGDGDRDADGETVELQLRTRSFFQTNTEVARALYAQAAEWVDAAAPASVWDLYCGVGGFALHCAAPGRSVVGVEVSEEAVAAARASAAASGIDAEFRAMDATTFALGGADAPELVIVNPPRRGVGPELARMLDDSPVRTVIYSSCNAASLARDLAEMPSLVARQGRLLDMFPHTGHYEVIVMLERRVG